MLSTLSQKLVTAFLLLFAVLDLGLAVATIGFPDFWFTTFHGVSYEGQDPQHLLFRIGGVWAAFSLFHFVALFKWKTKPYWLIIVGGMRLSEIFADVLLAFTAQDLTLMGWVTFLGVLPANLFFATFFILHGIKRMNGLRFFGPIEFGALRALADVLVCGENEIISADTVARRVDNYLADFRATRKVLATGALLFIEFYPLLKFKPPFSSMGPKDRKAFVTRHFREAVAQRELGAFGRTVQAIIRLGQQLSFLGYYSDPRTFESVGYVPFSERARFAEENAKAPPPPKLAVIEPSRVSSHHRKADVVIIGSGAAGAVMAHELVAQGRDVLILERGRHVPRNEFQEDEVEMISTLYDEGALQLASEFRMQVLQASCVGGTTVVNNAVCFDLPDRVLDRWNDAHKAGIDPAGLKQATRDIREVLQIGFQDATGSTLNPSDRFFERGIDALRGQIGVKRYAAVEANIGRCIGCGYCNIGCKYGTKLDMLETMLPRAQAMSSGGKLEIISECRVRRIKTSGSKVGGLECELSNGHKLRVEAKTYVLSAGAISSPYLFIKSGIAKGRAGNNVSFNVGSPITAKLPEKVDAYDGLQISHFLELEPDPGYVIETWFNPPVAQAMGMPGWFERHFNNMRDYSYMASAAPLVGTESNGTVRSTFPLGLDIDYTPTAKNLGTIKEGLKTIASIFLAGGAERVMPSTFKYMELKSEADLKRIDEIKEAGDVAIGTGHPQGGNAIGGNKDSVVDPEFRVRGFDNLFCVDASVFPTSIGVNPQLTVMSLAKYAAQFVK